MKEITLKYYGMYATGATVKEAKQKASVKLEQAITADYTPAYIAKGNTFAFCYRDPHGWNYQFCGRTTCMGYEDRDDVIASASSHVEQCEWTYDSDDSFPLLDQFPTKKRELQSWARWQRDFKRLRDLGHDDDYCHQNARS